MNTTWFKIMQVSTERKQMWPSSQTRWQSPALNNFKVNPIGLREQPHTTCQLMTDVSQTLRCLLFSAKAPRTHRVHERRPVFQLFIVGIQQVSTPSAFTTFISGQMKHLGLLVTEKRSNTCRSSIISANIKLLPWEHHRVLSLCHQMQVTCIILFISWLDCSSKSSPSTSGSGLTMTYPSTARYPDRGLKSPAAISSITDCISLKGTTMLTGSCVHAQNAPCFQGDAGFSQPRQHCCFAAMSSDVGHRSMIFT